MGTIISAIYDDIKLHGSVEAAQAWREREIDYLCADKKAHDDKTITTRNNVGDSKPNAILGDDGR